MPLQSLIWTALPNGFTADGRSLRISVLVSPRLDPQSAPAELASFADWLAWPDVVRNAQATVRLGDARVRLGPDNVDASLGVADPAAWSVLFPPQLPVRAWSLRDHSSDVVVSYDTVALHALVADLYGKLAPLSTDELPTIGQLLTGMRDVVDRVRVIDRVRQQESSSANGGSLLGRYRADRLATLDSASAPLAAFQLFHTPPSKPTTQTVTPAADPRLAVTWNTHEQAELDAEKAVAELDFHQVVAAMNQYPTLLRRLGLVLDFTIPRSDVSPRASGGPNGPWAAGMPLSVEVELPDAPSDEQAPQLRVTRRSAYPITQVRLDDGLFTAASRPASADDDLHVSNGLLVLDPERFALLQADVDGAGHKLINLARTLRAYEQPPRQLDAVTSQPRRAGVPALRNAGLMLVQRYRGAALSRSFARTVARDATVRRLFGDRVPGLPGDITLYAEDLVRGWRIDIHDKQSGRWRSLCERVARYDIGPGVVALEGLREEGTVRLAATTSSDGTHADVVYLHEAVTVWNGWSLAAQQPGLTVAPDESLRESAAELPAGVRMQSSFVATPGSLPRLRYGRVYAMRARMVDLAGNSLPPRADSYPGDETALAAAQPYLRFEPVQPPNLALIGTADDVALPQQGESMARLAVRTFNHVFDDPTPSAQHALRWAVAPRVSQREAELHGVLDGPDWGTPAQFELLATRDRDLASITVANPAAGEAPDQGVALEADESPREARATRYTVLEAGASELPYLPDPLATHVAARLFDHPLISPETRIPIPLYRAGTSWPDAAPFRIDVYEGTGDEPRWEEESRTLLVPIPKAARARLRLAAMLSPAALELLGVWNWVPDALRTDTVRRRAENGGLWPLTPWRDIEIVHAVQRPLLAPTIADMRLTRPAGATWVKPGIDAVCHRASTERLDLHASWHEPRDTAGSVAPGDRARSDVAFSIKVTDPQGHGGTVEHLTPYPDQPDRIVFGPIKPLTDTDLAQLPTRLHEFGDTRYRRVEYRLIGTTRFREYMPHDLQTGAVSADMPPGGDGPRDVQPAAAPPRTPPGSDVPRELRTLQVPSRMASSAGDAHGSESRNLTVDGPITTAWVLSSAPPPAPDVLYVVPTFGWTRVRDAAGKHTSWRRGRGIRVWLDRPWNASGYGEMLAVVLPPASGTVDPNDAPFKNSVTQWGSDPTWKAPFVAGVAPTVDRFPLARTGPDPTGAWLPPGAPIGEADQRPGPFQTQYLTHPGLPENALDGRVDVAPHDVFWDAQRRLWYCDIEIAHGAAYFPFVRLALARYQPSAVPSARLSNIVLADLCALAPDRWLSVTRSSASRRQVRVFGHAPSESAGHAEAWKHRTQAVNRVTGKIDTFVPTGIAKTNVLEVWLEQLNPALGEDFGWRRIADGTPSADIPALSRVRPTPEDIRARTLRAARADDLLARRDFTAVARESLLEYATQATPLWSGSVTLPANAAPGTRFRVVVAEYEEYLVDGDDPYREPLAKKARRLVFVEHVEVVEE